MNGRSVRVLIVEDNAGDARLLREMLADAPQLRANTELQGRLDDAIAALSASDFDVILLDLSLPDSHGLETVDRIRRVASTVPVVVLTGLGDEQMAIQSVNLGAQDYIAKNEVTVESLQRAILYAIERKRLEWVERERASLQDAIRGMDQVMSVVAHELRTPLASLQMIAEVLLTESRIERDQRQRFLESIHSEVLRMSDMVSDILEAARLESGAAKWNWSLVRAQKVGIDAIEVVMPLLQKQSLAITFDIEPKSLTFNGDCDALRRLLVNLLSNAIKHTKAGIIAISIAEIQTPSHRLVSIKVQDSGSGMPEHVAAKLGQAFALNSGVVTSAITSGTGLGLAICKGIVAAHGGAITVATTPGSGTTFTVTFQGDLAAPILTLDEASILREAA